ncbi:hypothetical protein D3C75_529360 [compost metagenome]
MDINTMSASEPFITSILTAAKLLNYRTGGPQQLNSKIAFWVVDGKRELTIYIDQYECITLVYDFETNYSSNRTEKRFNLFNLHKMHDDVMAWL